MNTSPEHRARGRPSLTRRPLAEAIRLACGAKGWDLQDLAHALDMSRNSLYQLLREPNPRLQTINKIGRPLGLRARIVLVPIPEEEQR